MTKVAKAKPKNRLKGPVKGKVAKKPKKPIGIPNKKSAKQNGKISTKIKNVRLKNGRKKKPAVNDDANPEEKLAVKKKPSKAELKSVLDLLDKEPKLMIARKALKYIRFYLKSEGLTKKLLKVIIKLWAEAGEQTRIVCLLCLIRVYVRLKDKEVKKMIVKKLYTTFLDKSRITKQETMAMITFMRQSLIELYKLDPEIAFKQAETSCQQLTVTLKNAYNHKNEETYKTVLNWQFANCLILLTTLIISHDEDSPVKKLTHQVIQLNLGALNFLSSPRYYPFYCHIIENLVDLSKSTNLFIPVLPHIIGIIDKIQLYKMAKEEGKAQARAKSKLKDEGKNEEDITEKEPKEYNVEVLNHVSLDEAHCLNYNVAVLDKLAWLLRSYLRSQCHKIAFPELVLLPAVQLKKWCKRNPDKYTQTFKELLEDIKSDCEILDQARQSATFAFNDYTAVDAWEKKMKDSDCLSLSSKMNCDGLELLMGEGND